MSTKIWAALLALPLALAACEPPKETGTKVQATVNLPEPPKLPPLAVAAQYENNVYSIAGIKRALLLHRGPKVLGTDQTVRGFVVEHYQNPCPKAAKDCLGKKPHFFIADAPDAKARLVVVPKFTEEKDGEIKKNYEVGKSYDFKGRFTQTADNGFTDAGGLLNIEMGCPTVPDPKIKCYPEQVEEYPPGMDPTGAPPKKPVP